MYATPNDVVTMARSILNSSLLRSALTRRWMKPTAFNSDPAGGLGAPWEIRRFSLPPNARLVDLYTKTGDLPGYSSILVLISDWDLGFVVMTAGGVAVTQDVDVLADIVADALLPAIEVAAREETDANLAGSYSSADGSSLVLATDPGKPGIGVTSWISGINDTDMLTTGIVGPSIRLYPSGLQRVLADGDVQIGYRAVFENLDVTATGGVFSVQCQTWAMVDGTYWGAVSLDEFLITFGADGIAKSVMSRGLRSQMDRARNGNIMGRSKRGENRRLGVKGWSA
jgi:hypothetical protein